MAPKKKKSDRSDEPRTKIEAEDAWMEGKLTPRIKRPRRPKPQPGKKEGAVSRFGKYLKSKAGEVGPNLKAVDKYYKEKWKSKDLQEQVKKKKKKGEIARLKAKGRKLREK